MAIFAKIVADSVSPDGVRLMTYVCTYPRFIHSELMTHRFFSRNAASSRAIPVETMLASIEHDPAMPVWWGQSQSGMQAREELSPDKIEAVKAIWLQACADAVRHSRALGKIGLHKQISNRITEPWAHMETVVSFTEGENFFNLRNHPEAQPEFWALARSMQEAATASTPKLLQFGQWHTPFVDEAEYKTLYTFDDLLLPVKVSTARCARVSYKRQLMVKDLEEDIKRHDESIKHGHMSPTEHQATPIASSVWCGNFRGWLQYRKTLPGEAVFRNSTV